MSAEGEVWRSDRSLNAELRDHALADAEKTKATRTKAIDYVLDRFLAEQYDVDGMTEVLVVTGLIENE